MVQKEDKIDDCYSSEKSGADTYCCTCGDLQYSDKKLVPLQCCSRLVCQDCINDFPQRALFCHFCQIPYKLTPSHSSREGINESSSFSPPPPAYEAPPTYESSASTFIQENPCSRDKRDDKVEDDKDDGIIHFLDHKHDTLVSLSFRYGAPMSLLRRVNNLTSDHLLSARRTVIIPRKYCKNGISLSPKPVEGQEKDRERITTRRFMVACKVTEYDVALLYLKQVEFNLESAIRAYKDDEKWEKEHPLRKNSKAKERNMLQNLSPSLSSYVKFSAHCT